ncbi:HAMP domain-containing sensor histidine kinase [Thiomicrorhabdus sp.]|uniref:sensor histidine kinase n=1 Tax=Thiomicrorhabdus sp. TaxID=2039724 RepID=UPI002AA90519|nr:HAMP domain-containing sensor histidine kinase [Thiomicrorhabdus sp.]
MQLFQLSVLSKKKPELRYFLAMLLSLIVLWSGILTWFSWRLEMHFDHVMVLLFLGLLLLTLVVVTTAKPPFKAFSHPSESIWLGLLSWVLILNAGLLYETGGTINPLIHLLLLPLVLAMWVLSSKNFIVIALLTASLYFVLSLFYVPLMSLKVASLPAFFAWYLHGSMWVFMLIVFMLAVWILPLKRSLEKQKQTINQQYQRALQNEYMLSVTSMASASVHYLSTPLNSLVLLHQLLEKEVSSAEGKNYLHSANTQLNRCIEEIHSLRAKAEEAAIPSKSGLQLTDLVNQLYKEFALLHPKSELDIDFEIPNGKVVGDVSIKLAILNLLDNAARYSPNCVRLRIEQNNKIWRFMVEDQGGGLSEHELVQLGEMLVDDYHGNGMGVLLSRMIIERFEGNLKFENALIQGVKGLRVYIELPILSEGQS